MKCISIVLLAQVLLGPQTYEVSQSIGPPYYDTLHVTARA